jgi:hypothetical protein
MISQKGKKQFFELIRCSTFMLLIFLNCKIVFGQSNSIVKNDSACGTFGYACGIDGTPPASMIKTLMLVNHNDKAKLVSWSQSDNAQNRIYGLVGLYFLKRNGITFSKEEDVVIQNNRNSEILVNYCQGCAFGRTGMLKNLLTNKKLKSYYNWYSMSRYKSLQIDSF